MRGEIIMAIIQQYVMLQMIVAILASLSCDKVRLYSIQSSCLSLNQKRVLPSWSSKKDGLIDKAQGKEVVYVDVPLCFLFSADFPFYSAGRGNIYKLKDNALRYAKRSCRPLRIKTV